MVVADAVKLVWSENNELPLPEINFSSSSNNITEGESVSLTWNVSNADEITISPLIGFVASTGTYTLKPELTTTYILTANGTGGSASKEVEVVVEPKTNIAPTISIESPIDGLQVTDTEQVSFIASAVDAEEGDISSSTQWVSDLSGYLGTGQSLSTTLSVGAHTITATVSDSELASANDTIAVTVVASGPEPVDLPPDPETVATEITPTQLNNLKSTTAFLYTGSNPIQTGVNPDDIDETRVAILRGTVLNKDNTALSGVTVSINKHPEYGQTLTREDGQFDLAINGGGAVTVNYEKVGFLPVQRQIDIPWKDYAIVENIVMIPLDTQVTTVDLRSSQAMQIAQGTVQRDTDGERQATILFPQGTSATMTLPDGSTQSLSTINVRATEYTVGENGPETMPGSLPPTSGYTYAVELSVDEAIAANASRVDFSQPLPFYVDNFLDFPVGIDVPTGWYDSDKGAWIPSENGRIIEILSINGALAELDVDGSGAIADATRLAELGISEAELAQLAESFEVGKSLWRVPITHFTPWDHNWPYGPPEDAEAPEEEPEDEKPEDEPCKEKGSIIECENQVLGESVDIVGTDLSLNYRSDRVLGRSAGRTIKVPLTGDTIPASLKKVKLEIMVAGQKFIQEFPALPNQTYEFVWDGLDAYGRRVAGSFLAHVEVGYAYTPVYYATRE